MILFINPCNKCVVRPICNRVCHKFVAYYNTTRTGMMWTCCFLIALGTLSLSYFYYYPTLSDPFDVVLIAYVTSVVLGIIVCAIHIRIRSERQCNMLDRFSEKSLKDNGIYESDRYDGI